MPENQEIEQVNLSNNNNSDQQVAEIMSDALQNFMVDMRNIGFDVNHTVVQVGGMLSVTVNLTMKAEEVA